MNQAEYQQRLYQLQTLQQQRETLKAEAEVLYATLKKTKSTATAKQLTHLCSLQKQLEQQYNNTTHIIYKGKHLHLLEFAALKLAEQSKKQSPQPKREAATIQTLSLGANKQANAPNKHHVPSQVHLASPTPKDLTHKRGLSLCHNK
jgi:hypothetical protein